MQSKRTSRPGAVEALVGLLIDFDAATESGDFYDRVCRAVCTLTSMERAALLLYDSAYKAVVPVGSHGADPDLINRMEGTIEETPIARRALEEDRVVSASGDLSDHVPARYATFAGTSSVSCVPVAAAGRWLGVIFADRAGEEIELDDEERGTMLTLGRLAALTASVEHSTERRERERGLSERIELTRELHEHVIQRLFGVCLVLGADRALSEDERGRCHEEMRVVISDLRRALSRPLVAPRPRRQARLADLLDRLPQRRPEIEVEWEEGVAVPEHLEPLTQSFIAEALRNVERHADAGRIEVRVRSADGAFRLEVENDGRREGSTPGGGLGLRLAALEALRYAGVVEFGPGADDHWHTRLLVPLEQ